MYAIIRAGSKQYRVAQGDEIDVELIDGDVGETIEISDVIFVRGENKSHFGSPKVANFVVKGTIVGTSKGEKISFMKYRPSQTYRKKVGHRQLYSRLRIDEIAEAGSVD